MRTIQLSYCLAGLIGLFLLNSCSSSQQFAGYYPQNRITGKGIGQAVIPATPNAPTASAQTTLTAEELEPTTAFVADMAVPSVQKPSKIEAWATRVTTRKLQAMIAASNGTSKSLFGLREKMQRKLVDQISAKYGMDIKSTRAASIESASRALAIVSFATGIAACVTWYGSFFFAVAAIVTGAVALVGIRRGGPGKRWMAIVGIVLGSVAIVFWSLFFGVIWL